MTRPEGSSRPEAVFVLLLLQGLTWFIAGVSSTPFAVAGETHIAVLVLLTLLLALGTWLVGIGVLWRSPVARGVAIALEAICLFGTALLFVAPVGANRGPVSVLVNVVLPLAVIVLLRRGPVSAFS